MASEPIRDPVQDHLVTPKNSALIICCNDYRGDVSNAAELAVAGDLTIHGVTRNVVFNVEGPTAPAKDPWGNTRVGLSATTKINRKDFGLTWNGALETGGILVGDEVTITLDVRFVKA